MLRCYSLGSDTDKSNTAWVRIELYEYILVQVVIFPSRNTSVPVVLSSSLDKTAAATAVVFLRNSLQNFCSMLVKLCTKSQDFLFYKNYVGISFLLLRTGAALKSCLSTVDACPIHHGLWTARRFPSLKPGFHYTRVDGPS